jgi:hypothetical protein
VVGLGRANSSLKRLDCGVTAHNLHYTPKGDLFLRNMGFALTRLLSCESRVRVCGGDDCLRKTRGPLDVSQKGIYL